MTEVVVITSKVCKRCGHGWIPKSTKVKMCPWCKSLLWDVEPDAGYKRLGKKPPRRRTGK